MTTATRPTDEEIDQRLAALIDVRRQYLNALATCADVCERSADEGDSLARFAVHQLDEARFALSLENAAAAGFLEQQRPNR